MITNITLSNVASYKDRVELKTDTDKPINLIYGLNGVGKTHISKFLANPQDEKFGGCELKPKNLGENGGKIFVYNQDFVNKNFYETNTQEGIFTLSSKNKKIKEEIERLEEEIKNKKELNEKIWEIKKNYEKEFQTFFKGKRSSKEIFCNFILKEYEEYKELEKNNKLDLTNEKIQEQINEIRRKYKFLINGKKIENINLPDNEYAKIENNPIFNEAIIGNENSTIANLIKQLENQDWVKQGFDKYMKENSNTCPFCQNETITQDFINSLKEYFDKTYEDKISEIKDLQGQYKNLLLDFSKINIASFHRNNILSDEEKLSFENLHLEIESKLKENLKKIEEKVGEPSKKITLEKTHNLLCEFKKSIDTIQTRIKNFNNMLDNKNALKNLEKEFWACVIFEKKSIIEEYKKANKNDKLEKENYIIKFKENEIKEKREKYLDIKPAVEKINKYLEDLGIQSFVIKKVEGEQNYIIIREGENKTEPSFKTLSEGEKTLISFLYFLQLIQNKDEVVSDKEKIIVIDDPISSLSFNYVYDVATLIKKICFEENKYKQIFVLTHNLYFFHELFKGVNKNRIKSFRIYKDENNFSHITDIKDGEILNDYRAYWQMLKDYKKSEKNEVYKAIIPNVMRNILECFFGFYNNKNSYITKGLNATKDYIVKNLEDTIEKLNKKIENLRKDNVTEYAFYRFIDRESHFDDINILDTKDIDHKNFLDEFKKIFEDLGHIEHYNAMMKD